MAILTVGIDLAKNVFALHGVNEASKAELLRPAVPRDKLHELITALPPCVIGTEACSGAHHWARLFQTSGHTVRLIAPKFVTPYRMMTGKRVPTTPSEWGPAERFVSGAAAQSAPSPFVDVQSVP